MGVPRSVCQDHHSPAGPRTGPQGAHHCVSLNRSFISLCPSSWSLSLILGVMQVTHALCVTWGCEHLAETVQSPVSPDLHGSFRLAQFCCLPGLPTGIRGLGPLPSTTPSLPFLLPSSELGKSFGQEGVVEGRRKWKLSLHSHFPKHVLWNPLWSPKAGGF